MTELHHAVPLLDACTIREKMRLIQWHLDNLWNEGWRVLEEIGVEEHRAIHQERRVVC